MQSIFHLKDFKISCQTWYEIYFAQFIRVSGKTIAKAKRNLLPQVMERATHSLFLNIAHLNKLLLVFIQYLDSSVAS